MRIIYHHRTRGEDAQGIHVAEMVQAFHELGHEVDVVALAAQYEIASSVAVTEQTKNGEGWDLKLDWLLEIKPASGAGPAQRRRGVVTCRIEPSGKRWKATRLEPVEFFKPS